MSARDYDVVLYGAGGFTGRQTVAYFSQHAPVGLRWAIAGPNRDKLEAANGDIGGAVRPEDILLANSREPATVDAVVSRARVVLNTAGPFALYGTPVVDACVRFGTHYADITGETPWVRDLIENYHARAVANATRIVTCCGFDSVPSDLGAFLMARHMTRSLGVPCVEVRAYYQLYGGFNGGTMASMLNMLKPGGLVGADDPFLLDPSTSHAPPQIARSGDLKIPRYDADAHSWTGPFFMAPTNTRVVRRSAALYAVWREPYGPDFVYQEVLKYDPPLAPVKAWATSGGLALFFAAVRQPLIRRVVEPLLPKPGTGPSLEMMDQGWFTCEFLGFAQDGRRIRGVIRHRGDPGNRATVKFLCESAMALAVDGDKLPGGSKRGGVLTPATGLGQVLADRLRHAGVSIDLDEPVPGPVSA